MSAIAFTACGSLPNQRELWFQGEKRKTVAIDAPVNGNWSLSPNWPTHHRFLVLASVPHNCVSNSKFLHLQYSPKCYCFLFDKSHLNIPSVVAMLLEESQALQRTCFYRFVDVTELAALLQLKIHKAFLKGSLDTTMDPKLLSILSLISEDLTCGKS